ncbi:MAG: sensor histidine kinase [Pseudomonadota bacterium]
MDAIEHRDEQPPLLPDFCTVNTLLPVVVIGQLLAFVLVLKPGGADAGGLQDLALTSLFVQWAVLSSSGLLCVLKRRLNALAPVPSALAALSVIVATVAVLSEAVFWLIAAGYIPLSLVTPSQVGDSVLWLAQQEVVELDLDAAWHADFVLRNVLIGVIVGAVALRYTYVQHQWKRRVELEAKARLAALQARIRPHFLFNSMNTIASFTRSRPEVAEQVVEDLADLFRATLSEPDSGSTVGHELDLTQQYLRIEQLRLGERLRVRWQTDTAPRDVWMPALCLQPLVENAVYHGIERLPGGGEVTIYCGADGDRLTVSVTNGFDPGARPRSGNQLAQANVRQRLKARFGNDATFTIDDGEPGFYTVTMVLPAIAPVVGGMTDPAP